MPRIARLVLPGLPHHLTHRGNNREEIFRDDHDHRTYLSLIRKYARAAELGILAYCLMPNHVHLVAIPTCEESPSSGLGHASLRYAHGLGVLAVGMPVLEVSAHHYTTEDFTRAQHTFDLVRRDETILNLDHRQCGLGSASCGPGPLRQYLIEPEQTSFAVRRRAFSADKAPPMRLARQSPAPIPW
jgi:hypothetical protein